MRRFLFVILVVLVAIWLEIEPIDVILAFYGVIRPVFDPFWLFIVTIREKQPTLYFFILPSAFIWLLLSGRKRYASTR